MTDTEIEALKAKHAGADLRVLRNEATGVEIVVDAKKLATAWPRFRVMQQDDAQEQYANKTLVSAGIVSPSADEFRAMVEERSLPGLYELFANECGKIVGINRTTTSRKI